MRRIFNTLTLLLLSVMTLLTSCLSDSSSEVTTYSDAAVTAVTLGTLNRYLHTTSSAGTDSVYKTTVTGSAYPMTIDQLGLSIYNRDSLPTGTDVSHVVVTLSTRNSSVPYFKSPTSDTLWVYNATDSVDFSAPRLLRVFSTDGSGYKDYTMTLNVRQSTATGFHWTEMSPSDFPGTDDSWKEKATAAGLLPLGAASRELYAKNGEGELVMSADGGDTWTVERLDESKELLPDADIACVSWPLENTLNTDYTILIGNAEAMNGTKVVWRKIAEYDRSAGECKWVYMEPAEDNVYLLPTEVSFTLAYYNRSVLAFGHDGSVYQSRDKGITWKETAGYRLPEGATDDLTTVTDTDGQLWLKANGRVWVGTTNQ